MTAQDELPPLRDVIARLGLSARRGLGQNYILDLNVTRKIARLAGPLEGVTAIEVGPGPGGLTRALLQEGARAVVAIERDPRFLPALEEIAARYPDRLRIVCADALTVDLAQYADAPTRIVANLPYNVATPLLIGWLKASPWPPWYERAIITLQREVADRLMAGPGNKTYGRLSVLAQWRADIAFRLALPASVFTPPPKVESAVVEIIPLERSEPCISPAALERVTAAAFGQRRKMLRASLRTIVPDPDDLLPKLDIDPNARAEQLNVDDYLRLAAALGSTLKHS